MNEKNHKKINNRHIEDCKAYFPNIIVPKGYPIVFIGNGYKIYSNSLQSIENVTQKKEPSL